MNGTGTLTVSIFWLGMYLGCKYIHIGDCYNNDNLISKIVLFALVMYDVELSVEGICHFIPRGAVPGGLDYGRGSKATPDDGAVAPLECRRAAMQLLIDNGLILLIHLLTCLH